MEPANRANSTDRDDRSPPAATNVPPIDTLHAGGQSFDGTTPQDPNSTLSKLPGGDTGIDVGSHRRLLPQLEGYELLSELGRGGMGVVYLARQKTIERLVAVKMILSGAHASETARERFRLETSLIGRLSSPGIVQIHDFGESNGHLYFSLEYCPGGSLAATLKRGPLAPAAAAGLVASVARGIESAHQAGVVHRDIKPGNILLAADGTPKITDFGLAKLREDDQGQTRTGDVMGTPTYMAPEQALGNSKLAGPAADVYALGAVLYETLVGKPPFRGDSTLQTLDLVRSKPPQRLRRLVPSIPRDLETICLKCLEKEPGRRERYRSRLALAEDLERWQCGEPIEANRGRWRRLLERAWRRGRVPLGIATAAIVALAAVYFAAVDAGMELPGGPAVRAAIDHRELSVLSPPPPQETLLKGASNLRARLADKLFSARRHSKFFDSYMVDRNEDRHDAWSQAQCLSASLTVPEIPLERLRELLPIVDRVFAGADDMPAFVPKFGWTDDSDRPRAEPVAWMTIALARAVGAKDLLRAEERASFVHRLDQCEEALESYRSRSKAGAATGGWNMYPNQRDRSLASMLSTCTTLLALLELRRAGVGWHGDEHAIGRSKQGPAT